MQDDWMVLYTQPHFQRTIQSFQKRFIEGKEDLKKYRRMLPDVIRPIQKEVFQKWNFGTGQGAAVQMQIAFRPYDNEPDIQGKAAVLNNLLGIDWEWVPQ